MEASLPESYPPDSWRSHVESCVNTATLLPSLEVPAQCTALVSKRKRGQVTTASPVNARQLITSQKNPTPVSCDNVQLFSILGMQHGQPKGTAQWGIIRVTEEWPVNICQMNE